MRQVCKDGLTIKAFGGIRFFVTMAARYRGLTELNYAAILT